MRFITSSDVHTHWDDLTPLMQPADVLILAGDLTEGSWADYRSMRGWLEQQDYLHKIFIAGNHDEWLQHGAPLDHIEKDFASVGATYLCHEKHEVSVGGHRVKLFGSQFTPI